MVLILRSLFLVILRICVCRIGKLTIRCLNYTLFGELLILLLAYDLPFIIQPYGIVVGTIACWPFNSPSLHISVLPWQIKWLHHHIGLLLKLRNSIHAIKVLLENLTLFIAVGNDSTVRKDSLVIQVILPAIGNDFVALSQELLRIRVLVRNATALSINVVLLIVQI